MKSLLDYKPQDIGYKMFFTNANEDVEVQPMRYARAVNNRNALTSDPMALENMKQDYHAGPIHFGKSIDYIEGNRFYDVDLKNAYPSWLLNYAENNFNYKVGGTKRYYRNLSFFGFMTEGMRVYKIRFAIKTAGREESRIYRRWFLKTTKVKGMVMTNEYISGTITLPDIEDLVNRFLAEAQYYEESDIVIDSIVVATGNQHVYINKDNIRHAIIEKNNPNNPFNSQYKMMLNASTGYLSIMDKIMYYTMVNQIRLELFKLIDAIDRWNIKRPDLPLDIVAGNTDGITIYAASSAEYALNDIITYQLNPYSVFAFDLKDIYDYEDAVITPNDVRKERS